MTCNHPPGQVCRQCPGVPGPLGVPGPPGVKPLYSLAVQAELHKLIVNALNPPKPKWHRWAFFWRHR